MLCHFATHIHWWQMKHKQDCFFQGFLSYMRKICPNLAEKGVVIGYDARHNSFRWGFQPFTVFYGRGKINFLTFRAQQIPFRLELLCPLVNRFINMYPLLHTLIHTGMLFSSSCNTTFAKILFLKTSVFHFQICSTCCCLIIEPGHPCLFILKDLSHSVCGEFLLCCVLEKDMLDCDFAGLFQMQFYQRQSQTKTNVYIKKRYFPAVCCQGLWRWLGDNDHSFTQPERG